MEAYKTTMTTAAVTTERAKTKTDDEYEEDIKIKR
jgi:hypothetical protein